MLLSRVYQRTIHSLSNLYLSTNVKTNCFSRVSFPTQITSNRFLVKSNLVFSSHIKNISTSIPRRNIDYFKLDRIPNGYKIVYQAPMRYYISTAQIALIGTGFVLLYIIGSTISDFLSETERDVYNVFSESPMQLLIFKTALFVFFIAIHLVIKRFALRIYYSKDSSKFIMMTPGIIPKRDKQVTFRSGEMEFVVDTKLGGILGQYAVTNNRYIIFENYFQTPYYLNEMTGHNKEK